MQGVKDRIKATFVHLIPDEEWDKMVKNEIDAFFLQHKETSYNHPRVWSQFQRIVWEELEKALRPKVKLALEDCKSFQWDGNQLVIREIVQKMLIENSDRILASMIGQTVQSAINNMHISGT